MADNNIKRADIILVLSEIKTHWIGQLNKIEDEGSVDVYELIRKRKKLDAIRLVLDAFTATRMEPHQLIKHLTEVTNNKKQTKIFEVKNPI